MNHSERGKFDPTAISAEVAKTIAAGGGVWRVSARRDGRTILSIRADEPVRAASTMKLGVLLACLRLVECGGLALDDRLTIGDRIGGSGTLWMTPSVRELSVDELLRLMICVSDNTATNALIDRVGMQTINGVLHDFDIFDSDLRVRLRNRHDEPGDVVNLTTANDQLDLLAALGGGRMGADESSPALGDSSVAYARALLGDQEFNDRLPALLPEGFACLHKTGDLRGLKHDSGVIVGPDESEILLAVLGDELRTDEGVSAGQVTATIARLLADAAFGVAS